MKAHIPYQTLLSVGRPKICFGGFGFAKMSHQIIFKRVAKVQVRASLGIVTSCANLPCDRPVSTPPLRRGPCLFAVDRLHWPRPRHRWWIWYRDGAEKYYARAFERGSPQEDRAVAGRKVIRYGLNHWDGLVRFLDDGRIELDTNIVERSIRPIVLNRKNALFAGHDQGAENWAAIASLVETCKLYSVDPQAYFADVLTKLVNLWPASRLDELMPWSWTAQRSADRLAA